MENTNNNEGKVFEQDLEQKSASTGAVFIIHLLMEEPCPMPDKDLVLSAMNKHLGDIDCYSYDDSSAGFVAKRYSVHYEKDNKDVPPFLMFSAATEVTKPVMDEMEMSQTWDCPEADELLSICKYQVFASDMLAAGLHYQERAELIVDYVDALLEIFPSCKAVVFETSKKMYTIVDTVGMGTLFMPDLQYHFHGMDPNWVVNHAYNVLSYMFARENPIKSGDHIDGIKDGKMSRDVQWNVRYEGSLIQPMREVIDFNMNEYASGTRG